MACIGAQAAGDYELRDGGTARKRLNGVADSERTGPNWRQRDKSSDEKCCRGASDDPSTL
jgi:hypothetical protein